MSRPSLYFDDLASGDVYTCGPYCVSREQMIEFNRLWDPLPMHLDVAQAQAQGYRDITASGQYTLCVKQVLLNDAPWPDAVIGALAHDQMVFPHPVYSGDELSLTIECLETRRSRSKPDRGIVKLNLRLFNQDDVTVLSYVHTLMLERR